MRGVLRIETLNLKVNVDYGVELADLKKRPGFYSHSGYPVSGNVSYRRAPDTYGAHFRHVDKLGSLKWHIANRFLSILFDKI